VGGRGRVRESAARKPRGAQTGTGICAGTGTCAKIGPPECGVERCLLPASGKAASLSETRPKKWREGFAGKDKHLRFGEVKEEGVSSDRIKGTFLGSKYACPNVGHRGYL